MKCIYGLAFIVLASGCGDTGGIGATGPQGISGVSVSGTNGSDGTSGVNGLNSLLLVTRFSSDTSVCPSGAGVLVKSGLDSDRNGSLSNSEATSSSVVCDGLQGNIGAVGATGSQGAPGTPAPQYQIVSFITPCPSITTGYREVMLRLQGGAIVASFSDNLAGDNTRLSILPPGSYIDSDGSNCAFTLNNAGVLTDQFGNVFNP